jgi:hypothetical protein
MVFFGHGAASHRGENYFRGVPGRQSRSTSSGTLLQHTADDASLIYIKSGSRWLSMPIPRNFPTSRDNS